MGITCSRRLRPVRRRTDLTSKDGNQTVFVHGSPVLKESQANGCQVACNFLSVLKHGKGWYYQYIRSSIKQRTTGRYAGRKNKKQWSDSVGGHYMILVTTSSSTWGREH